MEISETVRMALEAELEVLNEKQLALAGDAYTAKRKELQAAIDLKRDELTKLREELAAIPKAVHQDPEKARERMALIRAIKSIKALLGEAPVAALATEAEGPEVDTEDEDIETV